MVKPKNLVDTMSGKSSLNNANGEEMVTDKEVTHSARNVNEPSTSKQSNSRDNAQSVDQAEKITAVCKDKFDIEVSQVDKRLFPNKKKKVVVESSSESSESDSESDGDNSESDLRQVADNRTVIFQDKFGKRAVTALK